MAPGRINRYTLLTVIVGALVSCLVAVGISVTMAKQSLERDQDARAAQLEHERAQRVQTKIATCTLINTMIAVYTDPVPVTETGRKALKAWTDLGLIFRCQEN